ncbi:uncharacterized protein LOC103719977 [Phoenix dactylifera]|uniref:Uncharacterized protein LOC103719977 n=1 Tax=Phoenix dactylifera TaxID=42345 RepID=A0A8B7CW62_PHODC|nr:uncharacterized protein LOC103719977 [Phoenix dactylifera]
MDDDPLDFEMEDEILSHPTTKRRKVIGLDDLLTDYYMEKVKLDESKSKRSRKSKGNNSDEEDDKARENEKMFSKLVAKCQKEVNDMNTEDEIPLWGQRIFGHQKHPLPFSHTGPENCELLQAFANNELNSVLDLNMQQGESSLEGLLINGWLLQLALNCGFVEDSIASWTFHRMLYSSNEEVEVSACDFWCNILPSKNEADQPLLKLGWLPSYSKLKDALEIYGYIYDSSPSQEVKTDFGCEGPPRNIISWIKILSACCQIRSLRSIFSISEVEELLLVLIRLFLDRQLEGLSSILNECLQSIISFFIESEWDASCKKVADSIANKIPKDLNCLRIVECISGVGNRSKHLRSQLAFHILKSCFDQNITSSKDILELLMSMQLKDKNFDFFKLYIYLVLAENMLLPYHPLGERDVITDMWCKFLRNCSSQITSTDWRSYASKVRYRASYLLQNTIQRRNCQ